MVDCRNQIFHRAQNLHPSPVSPEPMSTCFLHLAQFLNLSTHFTRVLCVHWHNYQTSSRLFVSTSACDKCRGWEDRTLHGHNSAQRKSVRGQAANTAELCQFCGVYMYTQLTRTIQVTNWKQCRCETINVTTQGGVNCFMLAFPVTGVLVPFKLRNSVWSNWDTTEDVNY